MDWTNGVDLAARFMELLGVGTIIVGTVMVTVDFLRQRKVGLDGGKLYRRYRAGLARAILLGLEFLVAGDIIRTVAVEPTLENVWVLAIIVLIRTVLSFSLEVEIDGRWPWQAPRTPGPGSNDA